MADPVEDIRNLLRVRKATIERGEIASPEDDRDAIEAMFRAEPDPAVRVERLTVGGVRAALLTPPGASPGRVVLYLHGGSYAAGGFETHRHFVARLGRALRSRCLLLEYRLAPEHPFPAAVEDAVAACRALVGEGVDPRRLVVAGDSAGGGLALAALTVLRDAGDPLPAAGLLISPWTDLAATGESLFSRAARDPWLVAGNLAAEARVYLAGADPKHPLASPLYAHLAGLPPLLVHVGEDECLLDDATRIAERARAAGVDVTLKVWPRMWHVFPMFFIQVPEAREAIRDMGAFAEAHLSRRSQPSRLSPDGS